MARIDALMHAMLTESCAFFASELLSGPPERPYCGRMLIAEHHEDWSELVNAHDRVCVNAPRDHGKSHFFTFAYPIWQAWRHPGRRGYIFSASQDQASDILDRIKVEVESNPRLSFLLPKTKKLWGRRAIRLANGHEIVAKGFGTRVRGGHPIWIACDDILNDDAAYSALVRTKATDYFFNAVENMLVPGGQMVVVGTPFHADDLYSEIERNPEYRFRRYTACVEDDACSQPLWPERYPSSWLQKKRRIVGPIRFAREFLCQPMSDDMSLFPARLFRGDPVEQYNITLGMPLAYWLDKGVQPFIGVDFALSSNVGADYTVVWVMGVDAVGCRWIIDIERHKGLPYHEQESLLVALGRKYEPGIMTLEDNQMQRIWGDELIRKTDLPISKHRTGIEKHQLERGLPSLRILLENRKFRIPRGDARSVALTDVWISEMRNHTFQDGRVTSVGAHDDTAMACWICDQGIRRGAFSMSFGPGDSAGTAAGYFEDIESIDDNAAREAAPNKQASAAEPVEAAQDGPKLITLDTEDADAGRLGVADQRMPAWVPTPGGWGRY